MENVEKRTIGKVMWRLMPFLFVCYFVAYLDRVNVGFAKLQMNSALGLSEAAYGLGAGLFFISYFLLEAPSNLALDRPHHVQLGHRLRHVRLHRADLGLDRAVDRVGLLHPALHPRRGGGRVL